MTAQKVRNIGGNIIIIIIIIIIITNTKNWRMKYVLCGSKMQNK